MDVTEILPDSAQTQTSESSSAEPQPTPASESPRTFSEQELHKAVSDALARAGRDAKALAERQAVLDARDQSLKQKEAAEAGKTCPPGAQISPDDPARLSALHLKQRADADLRAALELTARYQPVLDVLAKHSLDASALDELIRGSQQARFEGAVLAAYGYRAVKSGKSKNATDASGKTPINVEKV